MANIGTWQSRSKADKNKFDKGNGLDMDRIPGKGSLPRVKADTAPTFQEYTAEEMLRLAKESTDEHSKRIAEVRKALAERLGKNG